MSQSASFKQVSIQLLFHTMETFIFGQMKMETHQRLKLKTFKTYQWAKALPSLLIITTRSSVGEKLKTSSMMLCHLNHSSDSIILQISRTWTTSILNQSRVVISLWFLWVEMWHLSKHKPKWRKEAFQDRKRTVVWMLMVLWCRHMMTASKMKVLVVGRRHNFKIRDKQRFQKRKSQMLIWFLF